MKKFMILLSVVLSMVACSSSSNDGDGAKKPPVTQEITAFANHSAGQWISECMRDDQGQMNKESLTINKDGTGSFSSSYYQDQNCAGNVIKTDPAVSFTYTAAALDGGSTKVTLNFNGQSVPVSVVNQGNSMTITANGKTVQYVRVGHVAPPNLDSGSSPVGPTPGGNDFDAVAMGVWVTQNCSQADDNNKSYRLELQIKGQGQATVVPQVYSNMNCSGNDVQVDQPINLTYKVGRFANGAGEITITGETTTTSQFRIQGRQMTITEKNGQATVFIKAN